MTEGVQRLRPSNAFTLSAAIQAVLPFSAKASRKPLRWTTGLRTKTVAGAVVTIGAFAAGCSTRLIPVPLGSSTWEDVGRCRALILRRRWPGAAFGPAPGDLVLLADPGLVGEPDLYAAGAGARRAPDRVQTRGETFLKASMAPVAWAWWRGRADSLRYPIRRSSRLSVCLDTDTWKSSDSHCTKSITRQRTTPWIAGIGPSSIA